MKTNTYYRYLMKKAGKFFSKLLRDFVAGIPRDEELIKTGIGEFRPLRKVSFRTETGKSTYHPSARSLSKKMTLTKEKKKEKSH
jgi:hypothetical protein